MEIKQFKVNFKDGDCAVILGYDIFDAAEQMKIILDKTHFLNITSIVCTE